ncbi:MAG: hemerythrin domain-containing protein [Pseudomonadota bacterium]
MAAAQRYDHSLNGDNGGENGNGRNPWIIEPIPADLIESPLDFIFAEHHRQREVTDIIVMVADGHFDKDGVTALIAFLEHDFALHIGDEEVVLFPVLREHCLPEDNVDRVIARLEEEHREDETVADQAISILKSRMSGKLIKPSEAGRLRMFAEHIRQHLALENGVLLPIARVRLEEEQLKVLTGMLKERR